MVAFASDNVITIGGGPVDQTTWGDQIPVMDPGHPLSQVNLTAPYDPMTVWRSQPSVRKVVSFIARNCASIPWHAYYRLSDTDRQRAYNSAAENLITNPRRFKSGYSFWYDVVVDSCLYDIWCVMVDTTKDPYELVRIPPSLLSIESDPFGNIVSVGVRTLRGVEDITGSALAISAGWSTIDGVGVSPIRTIQALIKEQYDAVQWRNDKWENGPKFSGYLTRPQDATWSTEQRSRFLESWRQWRDTNAGGTPILEDGMTYQVPEGLSPEHAQDLEGRKLSDAEVASFFQVPPELVGSKEATFSNMTALRRMLFGPVLGPRLEEIQQAVNAELIPAVRDNENIYVELDRESALNGSFTEQADVLSKSVGGPWLTRNEARSKQNLPAVPGGDELITPKNVSEGGLASPSDTGQQNAEVDSEPRIREGES